MWYGIIIFGLMVICLILYFVFEKKLKTPTVVSELLIKNYNTRLSKLSKKLKKLNIEFSFDQYKSFVKPKVLTEENLKHNITVVEKIKINYEVLNQIKQTKNVEQLKNELKKLKKDCEIYEFKDELKFNNKNNKYLEIFNVKKEKLNFENQKFFGSQTGFIINEKYIFLGNFSAYVIDQKNIFCSYFSDFIIKIIKNSKKIDKNIENYYKNGLIYSFFIKLKNDEFEAKAVVNQKDLKKLLDAKIKNSEE